MRTPKTPPVAKPINRPRIKVTKWRERAAHAENCLLHYVRPREIELASQYLSYLKEWIVYAEAILNAKTAKWDCDNKEHDSKPNA